jgi:hypothetical protein
MPGWVASLLNDWGISGTVFLALGTTWGVIWAVLEIWEKVDFARTKAKEIYSTRERWRRSVADAARRFVGSAWGPALLIIAAAISINRHSGPLRIKCDAPQDRQDRVYLDQYSLRDLIAPYKTETKDEADLKSRVYLCQWKHMGARITERNDKHVIGTAEHSFGGEEPEDILVSMEFEPSQRNTVVTRQPGAGISGECMIASLSYGAVVGRYCEFAPPPTATFTVTPTASPTPTPTAAAAPTATATPTANVRQRGKRPK